MLLFDLLRISIGSLVLSVCIVCGRVCVIFLFLNLGSVVVGVSVIDGCVGWNVVGCVGCGVFSGVMVSVSLECKCYGSSG